MTEGVKHLLREIKDGLAAIYGQRLQAAYLYGSYARGEEDSESDLDVLVVLDKVERYGAEIDQTGELISTLSLKHGVSISRVFVAKRDWMESEAPFLWNARTEAIPI